MKSINLSTRNLIEDEDIIVTEDQSEPKEDVEMGDKEFHSSMEHPSSWNDVMTISVEEDLSKSKSGTRFSSSMVSRFNILPSYCMKHLLLVCFFVLSLSFGLSSFMVLRLYSSKISKNGQDLFSILQHIGIYGFAGGTACLLSFKIAFHSRCSLFLKAKKTRLVKGILRKYLMRNVFDLLFLKQFLQRNKTVESVEDTQLMVSFMSSSNFDEWIYHKFRVIKDSPEGLILDSLGLKENEVESLFRTFTIDLVLSFHKIYMEEKSSKDFLMFDHYRIKRYIDNITLEKFCNLETDAGFQSMVRSMVDMYMDHIVCCVIVFMAVFGLIVGSIKAFS